MYGWRRDVLMAYKYLQDIHLIRRRASLQYPIFYSSYPWAGVARPERDECVGWRKSRT